MQRKDINKNMPDTPGVYIFRGVDGSALYIGKTVSLKKRVRSYFSRGNKDPRIEAMLEKAVRVDCIELKSEAEALILEDRLVKGYQPRYNIDLKDDKRYPWLRLSLNEKWPRLKIVRSRTDSACRYFGPYTDAGAVRRVLKFMRRTFMLASCRYKNPSKEHSSHCLYYHIGECLAPCVMDVSPSEYEEAVKQVSLFLEGRTGELLKKLRGKMMYASRHKNYEKAGKIRDIIRDLEKVAGTKVRRSIVAGMVYNPKEAEAEVCELKDALGLPRIPVWIEAFDISNLFGQDAAGSLIVFRGGLPYKAGYRRFKIKNVTGQNDYAMIAEIVGRKYRRALAEGARMPDLIVIDGGKGQYTAAVSALRGLGISGVKVIGLAKRYEDVYAPCILRLEKNSGALKLLMRIRDEAHRFAVRYHRELRHKKLKESIKR